MKHKDSKKVHEFKKNKEQNLDHFFQTCYSKQNFFLPLKFMLWLVNLLTLFLGWQSLECSVWSGSTLFAYMAFYLKKNTNEKKRP